MIEKHFEGIFQLSDTHILPDGEVLINALYPTASVDTSTYFRQALKRICGLPQQPLALVLTGDLVEKPSRAAYQQFRQIISTFERPFYLLLGNHDKRELFLDTFPEYLEHEWVSQTGFIQYLADIGDIRLLVLDSHTPGEHYGSLCPDRLAWLEQELCRDSTKPTIIALHHPPFKTGIAHMDECNLRVGHEAFQKIISKHPQVQRVICGHLHRLCMRSFGNTISTVCPSAAHQIAFQLTKEGRNAVTLEPAAGLMHIWPRKKAHNLEEFEIVSHVVSLGEFEGPYHF